MIDLKQHWPDFPTWLNEIKEVKTKLKHPDEEIGLVLYTDGGCRPSSRGFAGWGLHGYIYINQKPKQGHGCVGFINTALGYVNLASDDDGEKDVAALKEKTVTVIHYFDAIGSIPGESTNNAAELYAVIAALTLINELKPTHAIIKPDSEYALKGCTQFLPNWDVNNRNSSPRANIELWVQIKKMLDQAISITSLRWQWVKGHSDSIGNNLADRLATEAVFYNLNKNLKDRLIYSPTKDYWSPVVKYEKMLSETFWVFTTNTTGHKTADGYTLYHLATPSNTEINMFGKPISDTVYTVIATKNPDPVLESIRALHNSYKRDVEGAVVIAELNLLTRPKIYKRLLVDTGHLYKAPFNVNLSDPQGLSLSHELDVPRLALNACDALNELQHLLFNALDESNQGYVRNDITDDIYESVQDKKDIITRVKLAQGDDGAVLRLDINYPTINEGVRKRNIPLTIGLELPRRNVLTGIADRKPRVSIVTWHEESECDAFRYVCIVETDDGTMGIWSAYYSNLSFDPNVKTK